MELAKHYDSKSVERKWLKYWESNKIYAFDPDDLKKPIFSIDTPPPTVSGKMHMGHAFSYTQMDFVARFKRMRNFNLFYPFGSDDNGLPTERLVESLKNVKAKNMPREEFIQLCLDTLTDIRPDFIHDWKKIGISADYSIFYSTINDHCRKISQKSFLSLYDMGRGYRKESPTIWCPECQTAIAQVELEDKPISSFFNDIIFKVEDDNGNEQDLVIATTRPELLPACVAVFFHPEDSRYQYLKGKTAKVPLFDFEVPILPDERADPEKGTGIVMCCTFGDLTDIDWWKAHKLPTKIAIGPDGKITALAGKYAGMSINTARKLIIEDLKDSRLLISQEPIKHDVNVHERCGTAIEFLMTKQWFIKYLDLKEEFLAAGNELNWFPEFMKHRYDNWIKGLQWDWCISRQRYFGVPFPVWYCKKCDEIILADEEQLPVDPLKDKPRIQNCPNCSSAEFIPEVDVLDTWATSSLTPRLAIELFNDKPIFKKLYPMSLRPQAHDIITFWLFNTVVKSRLHFSMNPWNDCMISGWALDGHGKKMSKSKGNIVEPQAIVDKYSADCLRFWAASSKLGEDLWFSEKEFIAGKKLITKLWNASRFVFMHLEGYKLERPKILNPVDKGVISKLSRLIEECTGSFEKYEYSKTKMDTEKFFWQAFCDNYLELVKDRLYNPDKYQRNDVVSAKFTLFCALRAILKLFAPILPYCTEELYHSYFADKENCRSIHISQWPESKSSYHDESAELLFDNLVDIMSIIRKKKSEKKLSLKAPVKLIIIECKGELRKLIEPVINDLKAISTAEKIEFGHGDIACNEHVKIGILM